MPIQVLIPIKGKFLNFRLWLARRLIRWGMIIGELEIRPVKPSRSEIRRRAVQERKVERRIRR